MTELVSSLWEGSAPVKLSGGRLALFLLGVLFLRNTVMRIHRWYRLRHVPGPLICGFTSLWVTWHNRRRTIHEALKRLHDEYGPIVRYAPNEIACYDLEELYRISSYKSGYLKDEWYRLGRMSHDKDSIFTTLDPELRKILKKKLSPGYHGRGSDSFEGSLDRGIAGFIEAIEARYAGKNVVANLGTQVHYSTLDTLAEIAYSKPLGFLKNNKDMGDFLKINDITLPLALTCSNYTWVFQLMHKWPFNYALPKVGDKAGLGAVMGFSSTLIDERMAPNVEPKRDMLQSFINNGLTREELLEEVTLQFFAGSDTTANTITLTFLFLLTQPVAYRKLQQELDDAAAKGSLSSPIRDDEARKLPYLQACVRETLRLMPPLSSAAFHKAVPAGGDTVLGYYLPFGTRIATNMVNYAIGRSKATWGEDAEVWRPERWVEATEERRREMTSMVDLAFGHGQFVCLGKSIALMESHKVIAEFFRRYDAITINPIRPATMTSAMVWMIHDFYVKIEKRVAPV